MNEVRLNITEEILERVVFGMENQKDPLMLDPQDGLLRPEKENDGSFIPLPVWGSTDGYRLMDDFVASLPDMQFKQRLCDILHSGSGVFRHFKDALKERSELEGLWRRHKKREMRKKAISWFSRWSDALALEALGPEPEDWEQLSSAEFVIRDIVEGEFSRILTWHQSGISAKDPGIMPVIRSGLPLKEDQIAVAEGPSGEIVGFSWLILPCESGKIEGQLIQIYILPEFAGLGIDRMLAGDALNRAKKGGATTLTVRTGTSEKMLEMFFQDAGFTPVMTRWHKSF